MSFFIGLTINNRSLEPNSSLSLSLFRVVSYEHCGREYFTISNSGVSYYRPGEEVEFTPLETFAREYDRYVRLVKVNFVRRKFLLRDESN